MKRYVIERDLPGIGGMNRAQLKDASANSNGALAKLAGKAQNIHMSSITRPSASISPRTRRQLKSTPG